MLKNPLINPAVVTINKQLEPILSQNLSLHDPCTYSTPETEEMNRAESPSRTTKIANKAKEQAALRQAGEATLGTQEEPELLHQATNLGYKFPSEVVVEW